MTEPLSPQDIAEYAVWYARKVKGPAAKVAASLLEEFPYLREPLEAAPQPVPETLDVYEAALQIIAAEPEVAPGAIGVTARNIARVALARHSFPKVPK
jgi:hypothetical protein